MAQALEAKPAFGQIWPLERPFGALDPRSDNGDDGGSPQRKDGPDTLTGIVPPPLPGNAMSTALTPARMP